MLTTSCEIFLTYILLTFERLSYLGEEEKKKARLIDTGSVDVPMSVQGLYGISKCGQYHRQGTRQKCSLRRCYMQKVKRPTSYLVGRVVTDELPSSV